MTKQERILWGWREAGFWREGRTACEGAAVSYLQFYI